MQNSASPGRGSPSRQKPKPAHGWALVDPAGAFDLRSVGRAYGHVLGFIDRHIRGGQACLKAGYEIAPVIVSPDDLRDTAPLRDTIRAFRSN